jgi:hypothetical protein
MHAIHILSLAGSDLLIFTLLMTVEDVKIKDVTFKSFTISWRHEISNAFPLLYWCSGLSIDVLQAASTGGSSSPHLALSETQ